MNNINFSSASPEALNALIQDLHELKKNNPQSLGGGRLERVIMRSIRSVEAVKENLEKDVINPMKGVH